MNPVDVIIPVHGSPISTRRCLQSVLEACQATPARFVLVDDATPDPSFRRELETLAQRHSQVTLLRNPINLGFTASANRGMCASDSRDVVLLNSDTQVANDWLDRLVRAAYADSAIATVTPFTNNATICSFPLPCEDNRLPEGWSVDEMDRVFRWMEPSPLLELPTAVGFCMFIKRRCLDDIGVFDEARFPQGYGEENDFSMRARRRGWRHVLATNVFVYHEGGASFGSRRQELLRRASEKLRSLHPSYFPLVERHIRTDPARPFRQSVVIEMLRKDARRRILFVLHGQGGGTARHVQDLARLHQGSAIFFSLRPDGPRHLVLESLQPCLHLRLRFRHPRDHALLGRLLAHLQVERVHFHHLMDVPREILDLPRALGVDYDVTLHDYHLVNGNPTLTDRNGAYCWHVEDREQRCIQAYDVPYALDVAQWRATIRRFLEGAQRVLAPSFACRRLFKQVIPGIDPVVVPHPEGRPPASDPDPAALPLCPDEPMRVLVLGALSREKGAELLEACARLAARRGDPIRFSLIGYAYRRLRSEVHELGAYDPSHLPRLIECHDPHLIWFPARWPETYSYTLSEALYSGRPILAPAIGAFPERLKGRPLTWLAAWNTAAECYLERLLEVRQQLLVEPTHPQRWHPRPRSSGSFSYSHDYLAWHRPAAEFPRVDRQGLYAMLQKLSNRPVGGARLLRIAAVHASALALHPGLEGLRRCLPPSVKTFLRGSLQRLQELPDETPHRNIALWEPARLRDDSLRGGA